MCSILTAESRINGQILHYLNLAMRTGPLILAIMGVGLGFSGCVTTRHQELQEFEDVRGWKFKGILVGREASWVHLQGQDGNFFTTSIENFPPSQKNRILKKARKLRESPNPIEVVDGSRLVLLDKRYSLPGSEQPFTGRIVARNEAGQETARLNCFNGELHGVCTYFGPTGKRIAELHYAEGELDGLAVYWHPDGKLKSRMYFKGGGKDGRMEIFYPSGKRRSVAWWVNDKPIKRHIEWHKTGHAARETIYHNGHVQSDLEWNEYGELTQRQRYEIHP